jgi:glucose-1-phosphate thymidylyltransferase
MNIIIPMAGMGKRMRPHTLTTPKPLLYVAGKSIVESLIIDLAKMVNEPVDEVSFIIGDFGKKVEEELLRIAESLGFKGKIYYQLEALGTGHAIYCAEPSLKGNVLVAYADTLFYTDFKIDPEADGYIWAKAIDDPSQFGVVVADEEGVINQFVEKPKEPVSNLAIIGIYYFKDGDFLRDELKYLMDNDIKGNGEYQLTDALENMKAKGTKFKVAEVDGWFDCGNKNATVSTNKEVLKIRKDEDLISQNAKIENSEIIEPCFIADDVDIKNCKIGPYVSVGKGTIIEESMIVNSIIGQNTRLFSAKLDNSMIGNNVSFRGNSEEVSIGDFSELS